MLSDSLRSRYRQYKDDTDAIASWLAITAKDLGYTAEFLRNQPGRNATSSKPSQPSEKSKKKKNKKSKAHKEQHATTGASQPDSTPSDTKPYIIPLHDFIDLAKYIVNAEKPIHLPRRVINALDRAILVRKSFATQLPSQSSAALNDPDNKRHSFFVSVLEQARDILRPLMTSSAQNSGSPKPTSEDATDLRFLNAFSGLQIEEPSQSFSQAPDVPTPPRPEPNYHAAKLQDEKEALFAFYMLIFDYGDLRKMISKIWSKYKKGDYDLVSVAITTNVALDLARMLEKDSENAFDAEQGVSRLFSKVYDHELIASKEDPAFKEQSEDLLNLSVSMGCYFYTTFIILEGFMREACPKFQGGKVPVPSARKFDLTSNRNKKNFQEIVDEDTEILECIFTRFWTIQSMIQPKALPSEDVFFKSLENILKGGKISASAVFAAQIFLDITHILREQTQKGFLDLQRISRHVEKSTKEAKKFEDQFGPNDSSLDMGLIDLNDFLIREFVKLEAFQKGFSALGYPSDELSRLMGSHPLWCGLLAFSIKANFMHIGIRLANMGTAVTATAHLYNALRQEKVLNKKWKDMELLFSIQGEDVLFGGRPNNPRDYIKRWALSVGFSLTNFASNRRQLRNTGGMHKLDMPLSRRGVRGLRDLAPVSMSFRHHYSSRSGRTNFTKEELHRILIESNRASNNKGTSSSRPTSSYLKSTFKRGVPENITEKLLAQNSQQFEGSVMLLQSLCDTLHGEAIEFSFNYITLHRIACLVLSKLNKNCDGILCEAYPEYASGYPGLPERGVPLSRTAHWILSAFEDRLDGCPYDAATSLLETAARTMEGITGGALGELVSSVLGQEYDMTFLESIDYYNDKHGQTPRQDDDEPS